MISRHQKCKKKRAAGRDHPLWGIPRDSRGPLSGTFVCGVCQGTMQVDGRIEGGYRCRNIRRGCCWNRATSLRSFTHQQIGDKISERLRGLELELDRLIEQVQVTFDDHGLRRNQREQLQQAEREALEALENLTTLAEKARELPEIISVTCIPTCCHGASRRASGPLWLTRPPHSDVRSAPRPSPRLCSGWLRAARIFPPNGQEIDATTTSPPFMLLNVRQPIPFLSPLLFSVHAAFF